MRDVYYQSAENPLQPDRLPATRPANQYVARCVPFAEGATQIAATFTFAALAGLAVMLLYGPAGWSWLEPFDLLFALPVLLGGTYAAIVRRRPQWLLHPLLLSAAILLALNHRMPWAGHIVLIAASVGLLTYAFGWHWAVLCTAAPLPWAQAMRLHAAWRQQLVVLSLFGGVLTAALLPFDAVWLKAAVLTLPLAVLFAPAPGSDKSERWRVLTASLFTWLTYDAPDRPGLLQSPLGPSHWRSGSVVFLAVLAAVALVRWPGSPLPDLVAAGTSGHDAVIAHLPHAQGAGPFTQLKYASIPWTITFIAVILLPVALPWMLTVSGAAPVLWDAAEQRDAAAAEHTPSDAVRCSVDLIERDSIPFGRVVADGSPVLVPRDVFVQHAHGLGDSGSGKTSLFLCPLIEHLAGGGRCSLIVLDLKADTLEMLATLTAVAERVRRERGLTLPLKVFSNQADKATFAFNALAQPNWSQLDLITRTDILCGATGLTYGTDYGQGYYSSANAAILHHAMQTFPHLGSFTELADGIGEVIVTARKRDLHPEIRKAGVHVHEVMKRLAACGPLNVTRATGHAAQVLDRQIDLTQVFQKPQLLYFHLSATLSPSGAPEIARLVNYMLLASATQHERSVPVFLVIDEFQRMVAANLEYMLQLARSMDVGVILANQSMEDLNKGTTNLIPAIEANCRLRQWFSVSSSDDQQRLINGSGTTVDHVQGTSITQRPGGRDRVSHSMHEQVVPRITLNDILLMNDHPFRSVFHLKRGDGYAQYGGMPLIIESEYHISKEEYGRRKALPWPELPGAFVPGLRDGDAPAFSTAPQRTAAPAWSEEVIGQSKPITREQDESIERLFSQFRRNLPPDDPAREAPPMTLTLTPRDLELLQTLTRRVRLLTVGQAARLGWPGVRGRGTARRRLGRLAQAGWIELHAACVHPLLPVDRPLFTWRPGQDDPDSDRISRHVRSRWMQAARPLALCVAAPQTAALLGSTARRLPSREHLDHDLRLAAVYVHYRTQHARLARLWIGEHALPKAGYRIKDPDAFLRDSQGRICRVIESAGRYSAEQVDSFHEHCADEGLPYELW